MIQSVAFKNFRRFANFPELNLGGINIFVGRNNAGKSTVLKALQLMKGNLNTLSNISIRENIFASMKPMFVFDVDELAELHIDNFERALYNKAERKEITLSAQIKGCKFTIVLDGQNIKQNSYYVSVPYNFIELENRNIHITFNFQTRDLHLELIGVGHKDENDRLTTLLQEKENYQKSLVDIKKELTEIGPYFHAIEGVSLPQADMIDLISKRQKLELMQKNHQKQLSAVESQIVAIEAAVEKTITVDIKNLPDFSSAVKMNIINSLFENIFGFAYMPLMLDQRTKEYKEAFDNQQKIKSIQDELTSISKEFVNALFNFNLEYIHAHAASQKVIYLKEDKSDVLTRALSEFCKARIVPGNKEWNFVKQWMKKFEIGEDFRIRDVDSAGYMLKIFDEGEDPEKGNGMNLADKGTGSIQLMTLLLSLAVIMHKVVKESYSPMVLIEEPEQNIHPMLQSLLADLFLDFRESLNHYIQLIIETHSEYLIRRTQVIVAENNYKDDSDLQANNPFSVFYFDKESEDKPFYEMTYNINGSFARPFGEGFFDAAGNIQLQLLKIARNKKNV